MTRLPPVLLFDLDDTLVSFSAGKPDLWLQAFEQQAGDLPVSAADFDAAVAAVVPGYWGDPERAHRGRMDLVRARREVVALALSRLGVRASERVAAIADHYTEAKERLVAPFPGALEAVRTLRARGVRLGMVTNGSAAFQRRKLARFGIASLFEVIAIEGELGIGKPHAAAFEHVLERMGVAPESAWMIGDDLEADVAGAQALGMGTVWNDHARVGWPRGATARPDRIVHHVQELLAL